MNQRKPHDSQILAQHKDIEKKPSLLSIARQAEYAYQLGPRELAVFWIKLKRYDEFIHTDKDYNSNLYHYYQSDTIPHEYALEEFLHFTETMAVKDYPKYKRKFLISGWELAIQAIGKDKWLKNITVKE